MNCGVGTRHAVQKVHCRLHRVALGPVVFCEVDVTPPKKLEQINLDGEGIRLMIGMTRRNWIRNEYIRGSTKVIGVSKKAQVSRLREFGNPEDRSTTRDKED